MFSSAKKICCLPATLRVYTGRNGTGTKSYEATTQSIKVYADCTIQVTNDDTGAQFISSIHFYINGSSTVKTLDLITFENIEREIRTVRTLYNKLGQADLKVVYTS
jgi:hypothetical protein